MEVVGELVAAGKLPGWSEKGGGTMPLVGVFNLRREDRLSELEEATCA
jgi:hypothetical protein